MTDADDAPVSGGDGDEDTTTSTKTRWEWTGTLLAIAIVLSLPALILGVASGVLVVGAIGDLWFSLYSIVVLMAATWTFGEETLKAVRKARGK